MNNYKQSKHAALRMIQRGLSENIVELLMSYGSCRSAGRGAESVFFTKGALEDIKNDLGFKLYKECEKFKNAYVIVSNDNVLITVARGYRRSVH